MGDFPARRDKVIFIALNLRANIFDHRSSHGDVSPMAPTFIQRVLRLNEPLPFSPSPEIRFFRLRQVGGLVVPTCLVSVIGGLLPIALCGLTSL